MKKLSYKNALLAITLTTGLVLSAGASAQAVSLEQAISQTIIAQGQYLVSELGTELKQSISQEINEFSIEAATTIFTNDKVQNNEIAKNTIKNTQVTKADEE